MILSQCFHFVKCGYAVFSPFFCGFCHLSHRPETTSGVARKIGTGDARGKGKSLVFSLVSGANATVSRSLSANAPGAGDRILPRTPVARSLFVGSTNGRPHFSEYARRPRIDRTSPPSNNVQKRETPRRLPRNRVSSGFSLAPAQNSVQVPRLLWRGARSRLFGKLHLSERPAFAPRVTPPRGR